MEAVGRIQLLPAGHVLHQTHRIGEDEADERKKDRRPPAGRARKPRQPAAGFGQRVAVDIDAVICRQEQDHDQEPWPGHQNRGRIKDRAEADLDKQQRHDAEIDPQSNDHRHLLHEPRGEPPPLFTPHDRQQHGDHDAGIPEVHRHRVQRETDGFHRQDEPRWGRQYPAVPFVEKISRIQGSFSPGAALSAGETLFHHPPFRRASFGLLGACPSDVAGRCCKDSRPAGRPHRPGRTRAAW